MSVSNDYEYQWIGKKSLYGNDQFYVGPFDSLHEGALWQQRHSLSMLWIPLWPTTVHKGDYWFAHPYELFPKGESHA